LPLPEYIGMADTSYEREAVWKYNERYTFPMLTDLGTAVDVIPHDYATVDIESGNGDLLLPDFTADGGKLPTFCSNEWKQRVYNRRLRELGYGPKKPVTKWLGFSLDEYDRMKPTGMKWIENAFPLLLGYGIRYRRSELEKIILDFGWPLPPSSACDFCPNRNDPTWQEIKDNEPETWQSAIERDTWLRQPEQVEKWGETYLHRSMIPLADVDLKAAETDMPLFNLCGSGCWT
jgi:hypothetical protein